MLAEEQELVLAKRALSMADSHHWSDRIKSRLAHFVALHCFVLFVLQEWVQRNDEVTPIIVGSLFLVLHLAELFLKYEAIGKHAFLKHNKLDVLLLSMAVLLLITGAAGLGVSAVQIAVVLPTFRLFSIFRRMKGLMKLIFSHQVLQQVLHLISLEVVLLLSYAILGVELFCGKIDASQTGGANFNSLWESFQTCFLLLMGEGTGE
jgi:hypothetical protein